MGRRSKPHTARRIDTSSFAPVSRRCREKEGSLVDCCECFPPFNAHVNTQIERLLKRTEPQGPPIDPARWNHCRHKCIVQHTTPSTGASGSLPKGAYLRVCVRVCAKRHAMPATYAVLAPCGCDGTMPGL